MPSCIRARLPVRATMPSGTYNRRFRVDVGMSTRDLRSFDQRAGGVVRRGAQCACGDSARKEDSDENICPCTITDSALKPGEAGCGYRCGV